MKISTSLIALYLMFYVVSGITVCEHKTLSIKCSPGRAITIIYANYGRLSKKICRSRTSQRTTTCKAPKSLRIVKAICNGKRSCKIPAKNEMFGDPCYGVYKYLKVTFTCKVPRPQESACERRRLKLECPPAQIIRITYANYGRYSKNICPLSTVHYPFKGICRAASSFAKVSDVCNGRRSCSVYASNKVFGDPCPGVYKYLAVRYTCVLPPRSNQACERRKLNLLCPAGFKILITSANYGRRSKYICPSSNSGTTTTCSDPSSFSIVAKKCNGKPSCSISASNKVFRDRCKGVFKYLKASYLCI
ncbi:L-rhamnose-binding lectin CSL3-like [Hydractinia symbiolongicarpus]|uniref:L-rhamnose-binding lectin CSL3-like n=1 Tax=Hydractinia symbiolongicarpus TaxID=13093 RepID=UPI00254FD14F|nr:L-rhamnose-binding lectin CSL3-like [Hydractinia symbiolongicarpus]